jgi:hypothetical protein
LGRGVGEAINPSAAAIDWDHRQYGDEIIIAVIWHKELPAVK